MDTAHQKLLSALRERNPCPKVRVSDCVLCTKEDPDQSGLQILHVTEGLSFHPKKRSVKIHLDFIFENRGNVPVRCRVIHRGKTTASLQRFAFNKEEDPRQRILAKLFSRWLKQNPEDSGTILFYKRVNCLGVAPHSIEASLAGPGHCFELIDNQIPLVPEIEELRTDSTFTSYLLPPLQVSGIEPGEVTICTLKLEFAGESYIRLVGDGSNITVDSYARLMRHIETYEMPYEENDQYRELYETKVRHRAAIIEPKEYDIAVFQELGQRLELKSGSISATPVRPSDEVSSAKALCFLGQPREFCLRFAYPEEVIEEQRRNLQFYETKV